MLTRMSLFPPRSSFPNFFRCSCSLIASSTTIWSALLMTTAFTNSTLLTPRVFANSLVARRSSLSVTILLRLLILILHPTCY
ncbi:hypothetical protein PMAYCL1PPCAC_05617 [Pristionchus mayeri]|uniref:Uncharacterized protein n=1 Tax=Pristionchus mayeri TaxID=1317129 RepID=A0AAN4Z6G4_9BILA|nr:hypothetical protein PMAYCL1PPCAC_05617 [Pristionchus mayeri]